MISYLLRPEARRPVCGSPGLPSGPSRPAQREAIFKLRSTGSLTVAFGGSLVGLLGAGYIDFPGYIDDYGKVVSADLKPSAVLTVEAGGSASGVIISAGELQVSSGGRASDVTADFGGTVRVASGGTAIDVVASTPYESGAINLIDNGKLLSAGIGLNAVLSVGSGGVASDVAVSSGGTTTIVSGGTLADASIVGQGTISLSAGAIDTTPIAFVSSGGTLTWGGAVTLGARLVGFAPGDTIDLTALTYSSGGSATLSGLLLSVKEGAFTDHIAFASGTDLSGTTFELGSSALGGTVLTLVSSGGSLGLMPPHAGGG